MGFRYTNEIEGGQVIESDDLVPHLEGQALWVRTVIGDPDPALVPTASAGTEGAPFTAPDVPVFTPASEEGAGTDPSDPDPALVPTVDWSHEQLDEFAAERDIKFPANTNKTTKVAALTATA